MSYTSVYPSFPLQLSTLSNQFWVPVQVAFQVLAQLDKVYFPAQDARVSGLQIFDAIYFAIRPFVYNPTQQSRFDATNFWVNFSTPGLFNIISQIQTALLYKDRMFEKTNIGNNTVSQTSNNPNYLAAFASFNNAVRVLSETLTDITYIWDTAKFENTYSLTWVP